MRRAGDQLPAETRDLETAAGRVLAEDAATTVDLPPFDSSAMDGFALRSSDTPGRLPVVHRIAAGAPAPRSLEAGEAMGIATGGLVPEGADAVIPFEYVVENDNAIEVEQPVERGANVRPAGGTSARARPSSRQARAWRRATSPRWPQRAFPRCRSPGGRGPPSS